MTLNTYLNFGGNCEAAFRFYEQHLGAKTIALMRFGEMPGATSVPAEQKELVMHARLQIGGTELFASDVPPGNPHEPMRSAYLTLGLASDAEAERCWKLLAEGGEVFMPLAETFFASRFGMCRDRFGVNWMVLHERARST